MKKTQTDRELSLESTEFIWDTSSNTEVHQLVRPVLQKWLEGSKGMKLLDLGCGNGSLSAEIQEWGFDVTGTDFSKSGIEIAKRNFPSVNFFQSSMETPLTKDNEKQYDVVLAVEVVEHLLLPRQLFERAKEALKLNGKLIVTTPYHGYFKNLALALVNKYDYHWHPLRDYGHIKFFSIETLTQLFIEQGFEVTRVKRVGRIPLFAKSMMIEAKLVKKSNA